MIKRETGPKWTGPVKMDSDKRPPDVGKWTGPVKMDSDKRPPDVGK